MPEEEIEEEEIYTDSSAFLKVYINIYTFLTAVMTLKKRDAGT